MRASVRRTQPRNWNARTPCVPFMSSDRTIVDAIKVAQAVDERRYKSGLLRLRFGLRQKTRTAPLCGDPMPEVRNSPCLVPG
jgi:hypothetical protein